VWNRAAGRMKMFRTDEDFLAFERVMAEAKERVPIRILDYCVLSNRWHFVVWPKKDGELSAFFRWLAHTHAMRWRVAHRSVGDGPVYQARFKSLPVQQDEHLLKLCRYVEWNPVAAGRVKRAEEYRWGSLWVRRSGTAKQKRLLSPWPVDCPRDWVKTVNTPMTGDELDRLKVSLKRCRPYGSDAWTAKTVKKLGLEHTVRAEGRPARSVASQ
jgi:putative transposase